MTQLFRIGFIGFLVSANVAWADPAPSCTNVATAEMFSQMNDEVLNQSLNTYASHEKTDDLVQHLIRSNRTDGGFNPVPGMKCYRAVKVALARSWTDIYLNGLAAQDAGSELERIGFVNLLCHPDQAALWPSPYEAPHGAVLVYSGGRYGHIEVRVNNGDVNGFFSDYFCATSRTGRIENGRVGNPTDSECDPVLARESRELIGIYIKN